MIYLDSFSLPGREKEDAIFDPKSRYFLPKTKRTVNATYYPFGIFRYREIPKLCFDEITVFCGDNGSGKSTLLNVIAEKLGLSRGVRFNRSEFFEDYTALCDYRLEKKPPDGSAIVTSDDVFDRMLELRHINDGIDRRREELVKDWISARDPSRPANDPAFQLHGIDDYERFARMASMRDRNESQSNFLRRELMSNVKEQSNGESALSFFVERIRDNTLCLLDEPENSLSPANQIRLKYFIEDCARRHGVQFILSTHSPFLLSLAHARIYDLDDDPPRVKKWTELESVRTYRAFFMEQAEAFD